MQKRTIIRGKVVDKRTGLSSTTRWRLEKRNTFPARIQITEGGSVGYYEDEIDAWIHERVRGGGKRPPLADRGSIAEHGAIPPDRPSSAPRRSSLAEPDPA
jgi:predicted DNA-binding transcriptional regulator AlpA